MLGVKKVIILFLVILLTFIGVHIHTKVCFDVDAFERKKYEHDVVLLFSDIAFDEYNKVRKWENDIKVEIIDCERLSAQEISDVDSCISILAPLVYPLRMERVLINGNLKVYTGVLELPKKRKGLGYTNTKSDSFFYSSITQAEIYEVKYLYNKDILLHEFLHAIGLSHASKDYAYYINMTSPKSPYKFKSMQVYDSVMSTRFPISIQEKEVIRILYSKEIVTGLKKKDFLKKINANQ